MRRWTWGVGVAVLFGAAGVARASDPVGVYARIDKVVFEPGGAEEPVRVQVWGTFMLADRERGGDAYHKPARGYLYYTVAQGKEEQCRHAWNDLKKSAGKGCVAFGSRYGKVGRVRKVGDKPKDPVPFPVAAGVFKVDPSNPQAQALLKDEAVQ